MDRDQDQDQGEHWTDEQLGAIKAYGAETRDKLRERIQREAFGGSAVTTAMVDVVDEVFAQSLEHAEAAKRKPVGASTG